MTAVFFVNFFLFIFNFNFFFTQTINAIDSFVWKVYYCLSSCPSKNICIFLNILLWFSCLALNISQLNENLFKFYVNPKKYLFIHTLYVNVCTYVCICLILKQVTAVMNLTGAPMHFRVLWKLIAAGFGVCVCPLSFMVSHYKTQTHIIIQYCLV